MIRLMLPHPKNIGTSIPC